MLQNREFTGSLRAFNVANRQFYKKFFVLFLALLCGRVFAQTDYYFIVEKSAASILAPPVLQTLITSLVTEEDTVSAISYDDKAVFLFAPLPGNIPGLPKIAAGKLLEKPVKTAVTYAGLAAALDLADEQALAYERADVPKKLIIITCAIPRSPPTPPRNFRRPVNFSEIFYLALDTELDQLIVSIADPGFSWAVDSTLTSAAEPDTGVLTLEDGLMACIGSVIPNDGMVNPRKGSDSFSLGDPFHQIHRGVVLAKNTAPEDAVIFKDNKPVSGVNTNRLGDYSIIDFYGTGSGEFTVANGEMLFAAGWQQISPFVYIAGAGVIAALALLVLVLLVAVARRIKIENKPVWKAVVEYKGVAGRFTAEIAKKKAKSDEYFGSGVTIKMLLSDMRVSDTVDSSTVNDMYPRILYDKHNNKWFIEYKPVSAAEVQLPKNNAGFAGIDPFKTSQPANAGMPSAKKPPAGKVEIKPIKGSFEITHIFVEENIRLFLKEVQ
jgi:hypothetical protein